MNKQCFRVIFSKTRQRLVVVSELAKSEGKSSEPSSFSVLPLFAKIRPLTFSLFCALGFVTFSDAALGETLIIRADKSAPKNQQPIILSTANGIPQINIQTPNDKGLSHNKYSQFDVAEKGAILNNSRTNTQTQLAGQVAGNPYLARGEAKVILNEVNSSKPSVMKGYVEVAGKKAEVIIANPSGLHCEGCGIINSDRTTLTTGKPQIKHGHLDSFVVEKGKVKVSGKGLDNSRVDYTEIISRHVEANAGIWSKKETKVITGKNTVKRSDSDKNLQIIHTKQALAGESKPQVAIDVGELGGMYSGKIHLIGTEQGVGVRNAGHIGASADTLTIDSQGRIVNSGTLNAQRQVQLNAQHGIENQGKIENKQGDIQLNSKADIQHSGSIVARSGNIQKKAETKIQQSGETVAKGNITYTARQIHADKNSLIAAGVEVTDSAQGEVRKLETQSAAGKTIQLTATEKATVQGKNLASGKLKVSAAEIDANQSQNNAHTVEYSAKSGDIQANSAYFTAEQLTLSTPNELSTQGSFLTAKAINTSQQFLNAQNAVWKQTGEQDFHLTGESVNTQGSEFSTQGNFFVNARQLDNKQGTLSSGKSLYLNLNGNLNSADGTLFAGENLTLNSQHLNNDNGLIYAKQKAGITVKNGLVSNKNTNAEDKGIIAGEEVLLESQTLDNTNGQIISKNSRLTTSQINNEEGAIRAEQKTEINADTLLNNKGIISSAQKANLAVSEISQQNGTIEAQVLQLNSNRLASIENSLIFAEQLNITTKGELNNQDSRIVAKKGAYLTTNGNVNNTNGTIGSQTADLYLNANQQQLNNTEGKIVAAQQLNVKSGSLSNEQGLITANNISLDTGNGTLNNQNTLTSKKDKGIIAQQHLALNTKVLDNQRGNIISFNNAQLNTAEITNDSGQIRISSDLDIQAKNLSQQNGLITAGKATLALSELNSSQNSEISANEITLNADKVINQHSRLQAEKSFTLEAKQGITNQNGIIASKTASLAINTHQSTLDNANGTLFAQHALTIQSGELDNRAGLISAKQTEINTHQHQIDNRNTQAENKGIIGVDKLSLNNLSALNNEQGFIHSNRQLEASVNANINNQQGILNSNEGLTLNAAQIDNKAGSITAKTAEVNAKAIDNTAMSDKGSLILGTTQLVLNAEQLDNQNTKRKTADNAPTQGIQAGELTLNANTLSNQQGGIYIADLATMTVNQTLNNQQGEMLSDNGLIVKDNGNLSLNNQDGLIQAKNQVHLTAKTLEQEGSIKTQGDLTVRLKDSFTLNNAFEVGNNLDFSTQGDFTNNVALLIGNSAALSANQIINTASGEISSKNSKLTANEITNRGLIDGEQTLLNATQINNIGSGRIYGDHLALGSNQLINREENGSSATIAARKRLDFGVNKIINSNGSTMMSLGTMHFGKTLDENHQAVGLADSVQNHNAVIEALGRISFNVKGVENQHKLLKLEMQETSRIPIFEYSFGNEPQRYAKDTEGLTKIKRDNDSSRWGTNRNVKNLYALRLPDGRESEEWREYDYIRTINESMIILAVYDEAKIISGDKIDFYSSDVKNADSKIIANTGIEYHQGAKIDNNSTLGVLITTEKGKMTQFYNGKACAKKIFGKCVDHYRTTKSDTFIYNHETNSTKTFDLWEYSPNKNEKIVLGKDLEPQTKAKNVSLETVSITGSDTNSNDSTVKIQLTPTLDEKDKHTIVDSGQVIGKLDTTVEHFDATKLGELEMPTIKTHLPDINLPQASLYKINPEATNGYIVETDPKFTDRRKWLSSDYMFEQLRHNHDNVHKRLGDGFYEQRLINEQINQLTGRRFIAGYNNDLEQYKALMNSGVKYAKQFNLAVGVGLTAKQMSELTTDMVWLVNKEITLADGRKVTALVPQVYLVARNSDITSRGAVISANQIIGSADKIENSGVIAGLDLTRLHSNQLENRGAVLGKNVDLSAQQTLINLGGTIGAVDFLSLYGGKGVEIASTLSHSENTENTFFRTQLDRLASVKVTGDNGRLNIQSENDVTVKAASLNSAGSINIGAEKSLNITTLKTQNREHYNGNADNYYRLDQTQEVGNRISAKGNIRAVSGGDMVVRQSDISSESGKVLLGSRQGDVRIEAGRAEERLETARKSTSRGMFSKTTDTSRYAHHIDNAVVSRVDGLDVNIIAQQGNVSLIGTQATAKQDINVTAGKSVLLDVAVNYSESESFHESKKSGITASVSKGMASIGYARNKSQIDDDNQHTSVVTSILNAATGDLNIVALEGDVTANAAQLQSGSDMHVQGKNVYLNALTENESRHVSHYARSAGIGVNMVYNPKQVFKDNFGEQANQGSAVGIVGKIFTTAEAVGKTTNQVFTPGGVYGHSQRSRLEKEGTQSNAVVSTVDVGGNLSIIATQGDIQSQGAQFSAKGNGEFWAQENVNLDVAVSTSGQNSQEKRKGAEFNLGKGSAGVYAERALGDGESRTEQASVLSFGGNLSLNAQEGNITLKGTQAVAEGNVSVNAGKDVRITTATTRTATDENRGRHGIGEAVISETERFNGYHRQLSSENGEQVSHQQALIASLNDSVSINAGNQMHSTSGQILAKNRIDVSAEEVTFDTVHNIGNSQSHSSDLKIGQFARVSSPIIDLIQTVEQAVNNKDASDRVKAAQALGAAAKAYSTAADLANGGALFRVETGSGFSHSRERNEISSRESVGNQLNAQHINITSRSGDITATHTAFTSKDVEGNRLKDSSITFDSAKDLNLNAGQSEYQMQGKQQSSGVEIGTGMAVGAQTGWYVYAQAGFSNGKQSEHHLTHQNSQIDTETLNINTQGNATLKGATAKANRINAEIKGNLTIESLQDIHQSESNSAGFGGRLQGAIGSAWGGSAYGNLARGEANRKQVTQQSGLFAGEGGYHINANNVDLVASVIASSNSENSELATNKLSFRDIENQSSSEALSAGVSASVNLNKATGTEVKTEAQAKQQAQTAKLTGTPQSNGISPSIPMFDSSEDRSITKATLTEGKITLNKDSNPTQTTAKSLGINTDLSQSNRQVAEPKDINKVLKEQQILSQAAGNVAEAVMTYAENQKAELQQAEQKAREATKSGDTTTALAKLQEADKLKIEAERWETGGDQKRKATAVAAALSLAVAGKPAEAIAAGAASPYLNEAIKHITENTDNKALEALNVPLHILWGAVEAELAGGSATAGAVAAGVGEIGARVLAETVYGKQPSELNEEEKQNLLNASKALAGVSSGVVSGGNGTETLANASVGMVVAENAVENNALNASDSVNYLRDLSEAYKKGESLEVVHEKYAILSQREFEKDIDACKNGGLMCYVGVLSAMKAGVDSIEGYKDFYALPTEIKQEAVDWVSTEAAKHSIEFIDGSPTAIYLALTAIEIAQEMYEAKNAGRNFSVDKAQAKFAQKINAYNPHKHSVGNMNDFLKNKEFGQNLSQILTKTSKRYQGQTIYEVNKSELGFKKGDQIYLDNLHKDHLEVFDRNGNFKGVYNLDGSLNAEKTKNSYGRKLSK